MNRDFPIDVTIWSDARQRVNTDKLGDRAALMDIGWTHRVNYSLDNGPSLGQEIAGSVPQKLSDFEG